MLTVRQVELVSLLAARPKVRGLTTKVLCKYLELERSGLRSLVRDTNKNLRLSIIINHPYWGYSIQEKDNEEAHETGTRATSDDVTPEFVWACLCSFDPGSKPSIAPNTTRITTERDD